MDCDNEEVQATKNLKRKKKNKCEFKKGDRTDGYRTGNRNDATLDRLRKEE